MLADLKMDSGNCFVKAQFLPFLLASTSHSRSILPLNVSSILPVVSVHSCFHGVIYSTTIVSSHSTTFSTPLPKTTTINRPNSQNAIFNLHRHTIPGIRVRCEDTLLLKSFNHLADGNELQWCSNRHAWQRSYCRRYVHAGESDNPGRSPHGRDNYLLQCILHAPIFRDQRWTVHYCHCCCRHVVLVCRRWQS